MNRFRGPSTVLGLAALGLAATGIDAADEPAAAELFRKSILPVMREHCFGCHGAGKAKGGLKLETRAALLAGGANGAVWDQAKPADSVLLKAVRHEGPRMPPKLRLPDAVVADFGKWLAAGAPYTESSGTGGPTTAPAKRNPRDHWAYRPIRRPNSPGGAAHPIDAFINAKLTTEGLAPSPPADRATLLRRATFDLLGLPPAPEEVAAFLGDPDPDTEAYERVLDRLLASPRYGERWGRHWLDVARYADSAGYEIDNYYEHAFEYRDWVIRSLNDDKPFDRFIHEQLAGDELWPDSADARAGLGFLLVGPYAYEGGIQRAATVEYQRLTDLADTTGAAFLGLTVGCSRCHDHKFDALTQADYFGLQAIFANSGPVSLKPNAKDADNSRREGLKLRDKPGEVRLLKRGEIDLPVGPALPALPAALPGGGVIVEKAPGDSRHRRSVLARWLTSPDNPLTARVIANRVWHWHFGQGLVRTPDDFGVQGEPPTHPELLDWLADRLRSDGWSLKRFHRLIMTSDAYRRAATARAGADGKTAAARDPDCRLLSRFPRRRLEAEAVWDSLLAAAGTLDLKMYGPAVYPPIEREALTAKGNLKWESERDKAGWTRRAVYMVVRRSLALPFLERFNSATPTACCGRRESSLVPPQALELLNGAASVPAARAMAGRLITECGDDTDKIVARAWLIAFGRPASAEERSAAADFLVRAAAARAAKPGLAPTGLPAEAKLPPPRGAALTEFCLALLNANEFLFVD